MKHKLFISMFILSSVGLANPNTTTTEETINLAQSHIQQTPTQNQPRFSTTQPQSQDSNVAQPMNPPLQNQPTPNQPNPQVQNIPPNIQNNGGRNYGVSLQTILDKVYQMYPGAFITDVDYKGFGYEVEINDNLELFFDMNGNLIGQKWD